MPRLYEKMKFSNKLKFQFLKKFLKIKQLLFSNLVNAMLLSKGNIIHRNNMDWILVGNTGQIKRLNLP